MYTHALLAWSLLGVASLSIRYTNDSFSYLSFARGFAEHHALASKLLMPGSEVPRPLDLWPPLFPFVWSIGLKLGLSDTAAVRALQHLSAGVLLWALAQLIPGAVTAARTWLIAVLLLIYTPFLATWGHAWSEPLAIALLAASLATVQSPRSALRVAISGALLGGATLTRYLLGSALPFVLLPLVHDWQNGERRSSLRNAAAFLSSYAAVVAPWLLRNQDLRLAIRTQQRSSTSRRRSRCHVDGAL